jgi:hypothetical protein
MARASSPVRHGITPVNTLVDAWLTPGRVPGRCYNVGANGHPEHAGLSR